MLIEIDAQSMELSSCKISNQYYQTFRTLITFISTKNLFRITKYQRVLLIVICGGRPWVEIEKMPCLIFHCYRMDYLTQMDFAERANLNLTNRSG